MFTLFSASLVAFCFCIVESAPITILDDREESFSFPVVHRADTTSDDRQAKVSGTLDVRVVVSPVTGCHAYLCPITIGGQNLNLEFDTGSTTFWVFSTLMTDQNPGHTYFNKDQSPSYKRTRSIFATEYGDDSTAAGRVGIDTLSIFNIQVEKQIFGLASEVNGEYLGDGTLGLGFADINDVSGPTFFDNLKTYLTAPLLATYFPWKRDGYLDFGATVDSRYTQPIQYAPVDGTKGRWEFKSPSYKVGKKIYSSKRQIAYPDSGTPYIFLQKKQVENYYKDVANAEYDDEDQSWVFPCETPLPDLSFAVGNDGAYATIVGGENGGLLNLKPYSLVGGYCMGTVQVSDELENNIGLPFFGTYYIVFEATNENSARLGFADLNPDDYPGATSGPSG